MSAPGEHRLDVQDLLDGMIERPYGTLAVAAVVLLLIGVVGFIAGLLQDAPRTWTALVWNWAFWSGLSTGGAILVAAASTAKGRWLRPLRRFGEAMTAFLPLSYLIMIVLFFGLEHVYSWVNDPPPAKAAYLNETFFVIRELVLVAVVYGLALALVYWSLRPDLGRLREKVGGWRRGLYGWLTPGWRDIDAEIERAHVHLGRLAPILIVVWALLWTIWAWDWLMSVDPYWYSTLFGAWIFMTHFLAAIGATAFLACLVRGYRSFPEAVDRRSLHDIGKMLFAFTIFWTYLFFGQYLVIWYGRLPEETSFVELRLWGAYEPVAIFVFAAVFLIPFIGLLGVRPKRTPSSLAAFSLVSLIGIWFFHMLIVAPGVFPDAIALGWIEAAVAMGMLGAFALSVLLFLTAFPAIAIAAGLPTDPEVEKLAELTEPHHH